MIRCYSPQWMHIAQDRIQHNGCSQTCEAAAAALLAADEAAAEPFEAAAAAVPAAAAAEPAAEWRQRGQRAISTVTETPCCALCSYALQTMRSTLVRAVLPVFACAGLCAEARGVLSTAGRYQTTPHPFLPPTHAGHGSGKECKPAAAAALFAALAAAAPPAALAPALPAAEAAEAAEAPALAAAAALPPAMSQAGEGV